MSLHMGSMALNRVDVPFLSSIVTVSLAHFMRNLDGYY